jgi:hypothetical protein
MKNSDVFNSQPISLELTDGHKIRVAAYIEQVLENPALMEKDPYAFKRLIERFLETDQTIRSLAETPMNPAEAMDDISLLDYVITMGTKNIKVLNVMIQNVQMSHKSDPTASAGSLKVLSQITQQLINTLEKAQNYRNVAEFRQQTVAVLDRVLTPDQRNEVMDKLRSLAHRPTQALPDFSAAPDVPAE